MSIYDFTVQKQDGTDQSMAEYQGQVLLIVNTAPLWIGTTIQGTTGAI